MFRTKVKNRISITEKLINRSLSGQRLGLVIHNHLNWRIHLCWSTETGTHSFRDCIEKVFIEEKEWLCFCKSLKFSGVHGLAACIVSGITYKKIKQYNVVSFYKMLCGVKAVCG